MRPKYSVINVIEYSWVDFIYLKYMLVVYAVFPKKYCSFYISSAYMVGSHKAHYTHFMQVKCICGAHNVLYRVIKLLKSC